MNGTLNLKIFISVSLGLHLLLLSVTTFLFPDFKIDRFPILNIEVSLLPLITEEKPIAIPVSPARLKTEIKEEDMPQKENKEEPPYKKELEPESPQAVRTVATNIIIEEPKFLPLEDKEWEMGNGKEPVIQAINISLQSDSTLTSEKENLTIAMPPSQLTHGNPHLNATPAEKSQDAVKLQPRSGGEILFAQPRYAENPKPLYPQEARKKGYEGEVILRVEVLSDGRVGKVEVKKSSGYELLDRSAFTTVRQWKFIPAKKGEEIIPLWVNIPIKFQLR